MQETIISILKDSINAPSGENTQPWKFTIKNDELYIFNTPRSAHVIYNPEEKASYFAHGALLENITIAASHYGYSTDVQLFPDDANHNLVAKIILRVSDLSEDELYQYISKRHTNRNTYTGEKITEHEKDVLLSSTADTSSGKCTIITSQSKIDELSKILTPSERIIFENKSLHDFLYKHIIWNKKYEMTRKGFYIKTLETSSIKIIGMRILQYWTLLQILNIFGVSKIIAKIFELKNRKSGAFALISVTGDANTDYIQAGRTSQRIWLTATKLGLAVQPATGILYLMKAIEASDISPFSEKHTQEIRKTLTDISNIFNNKDNMLMIFRIGRAPEPEAFAVKFPPHITIE